MPVPISSTSVPSDALTNAVKNEYFELLKCSKQALRTQHDIDRAERFQEELQEDYQKELERERKQRMRTDAKRLKSVRDHFYRRLEDANDVDSKKRSKQRDSRHHRHRRHHHRSRHSHRHSPDDSSSGTEEASRDLSSGSIRSRSPTATRGHRGQYARQNVGRKRGRSYSHSPVNDDKRSSRCHTRSPSPSTFSDSSYDGSRHRRSTRDRRRKHHLHDSMDKRGKHEDNDIPFFMMDASVRAAMAERQKNKKSECKKAPTSRY